MKMFNGLRYFQCSGIGNYSYAFNWDNGLRFGDLEPIEPVREFDAAGVYPVVNNSHGGSRNVTVVVAAFGTKSATRMLQEYADSFPVVEYQE